MSRWTHISGCIELDSTPFECKKINSPEPQELRNEKNEEAWIQYWKEKKKKSYYPYPEEQFVLGVPTLQDTWDGKSYTRVQVYEYSLPRARKYIEEALELLPQGEVGWHPAIKQDKYDCRSSSSCGEYDCQNKAFQQGMLNLYKDEFPGFSFKELEKYLRLQFHWIDHITNIIIGIREDIRYCSGLELMEGLEQFFSYLKKNDIEVENGYLEWYDEWDSEHIYAWRCTSQDDYECDFKFMILDSKTNSIIYMKKYNRKKDQDGDIDWLAKGWDIIEEGDKEWNKK